MKLDFVARLDAVRHACGFPFLISSGYRTDAHNARVGGVDSSTHMTGYAADIRAGASATKYAIVSAALSLGFTRIGIGATFIHLDAAPTMPQPVLWTY